jgi:hypothetical protein
MIASMSQIDWYIQKAEQCARLAASASDSSQRSKFETERTLWLEIAEQVRVAERADTRKM